MHRQNIQYLRGVGKRHETFYKSTLNCNMVYILIGRDGDGGAKMAKKRRKTCEIVDNFSAVSNFPAAFS